MLKLKILDYIYHFFGPDSTNFELKIEKIRRLNGIAVIIRQTDQKD